MRFTLVLLLLAFCAIAFGKTHKKAGKQFLEKQKKILTLFKHIIQPTYDKEHNEILKTFKMEDKKDEYTNLQYFEEFMKYYKYDKLPRGEIFSVFYYNHLRPAISLFKLFYYAKDFKTFYETAVWARNNVNEGMFLYSVSVAIIHRNDTYGIVIPPIYEIYPFYFFNTEVIHKAQQYKMGYREQGIKPTTSSYKGFTIPANYSGYYLNLNPEQSMAYFMEDVGYNAQYYYFNIYYPFWMDGEEFRLKYDNRGEIHYFVYQQILARFYLERLSNYWGEIPWFNWDLPIETGYYPSLRYPNGLEFPTRPNFAKLHEYFYNYGQKWTNKGSYGYSYEIVQQTIRRLNDAVDSGFIYTEEGKREDLYSENGFNMFANMIESNPDSPNNRYYQQFQLYARHLLGYSLQPQHKYQVAPSALEHFETSMRDPVFYQLYKQIYRLFFKYQYHLGKYTAKDMAFPGVKVTKMVFDKLYTYFDYFYSDITNALYVSPEEYEGNKFQVRVKQERLNHKPFTYKIYVESDKEIAASVKVFIGPKYDEYNRTIDINENRMNFVMIDHFPYDLKKGSNVIERNNRDATAVPDRTTYKKLMEKVEAAYSGNEEFILDGEEAYFGMPLRFLLPMGSRDGMEFQFYTIVYPLKPYKYGTKSNPDDYFPRVGTGAVHSDGYSFGFPFDRLVDEIDFYRNVPNHHFHTEKIYFVDADEINTVQ